MRAGPGLNNNNDNINEFMNQKCKFIMNSDLIKIKNPYQTFSKPDKRKKESFERDGFINFYKNDIFGSQKGIRNRYIQFISKKYHYQFLV